MAASLGPNSRGEGELIFLCLGVKTVPLGEPRHTNPLREQACKRVKKTYLLAQRVRNANLCPSKESAIE